MPGHTGPHVIAASPNLIIHRVLAGLSLSETEQDGEENYFCPKIIYA